MKRVRMSLGGAIAALTLFVGSHALAQNDTFIIGVGSEVQNLDPRLATDVASAMRTSVMIEPLVAFNRSLGLEPRLATDWELADDLLSLTFQLREDVTFHNGQPFTSADVRYTFETVLDEDFGARNRALYSAIESIDTPDDHTVVFNLAAPNVFLINNLARMPILPNDDSLNHEMHPIGTGPYKFVSQSRDNRLVMERFDDYWGGTGEIQTIEFRVMPENSTRLLSFEAGEIDATQSIIPATELPRLEEDDRFIIERTAGTGYTYLAFNSNVEGLDNPTFRQALSYMVPREAIVERVLNGNGFLGISMLLPSMQWFNPDVTIYDYNPERAAELLAESGFDMDRTLRLTTSEDAARMQIAEILAFEFGQLGVDVEVVQGSAAHLFIAPDGNDEAGDQAAVIEASSHALALHRCDSTRFAAAVFTNLTQDHLDFHGEMEPYFAAKRKLFELAPEVGIINLDDEYGAELAAEFGGIGYSAAGNPAASLRAEAVSFDAAGSRFRLIYDLDEAGSGEFEARIQLPGHFNVANALAAIGAAARAGVAVPLAAEVLAEAARVPGRFEPVDAGQDFTVLVDYAHTPDSLENVLRAARRLTDGRLIAVFGAGGDRDRDKRPKMGRAGALNADQVVITSDNPRSEEPERIVAEVAAGTAGGSAEVSSVVDRREAIATAIKAAEPGDVVVIAGKGHEQGQEFENGHKIPFDDRVVAAELLAGTPTPGTS